MCVWRDWDFWKYMTSCEALSIVPTLAIPTPDSPPSRLRILEGIRRGTVTAEEEKGDNLRGRT